MTTAINLVSPHTAKEWLDSKEAILIDVREKSEFDEEHIKGAVSNPVSAFNADAVKKICGGKKIIFQCRSGKRACMTLEQFVGACPDVTNDKIFSMDGSILAWKEAGLPTVNDAPISLERQVMIVAGGVTLTGALFTWLVSSSFILIPLAVGAGLLFAGTTGTCYLKKLLMRLPYNQQKPPSGTFCMTPKN